MKRYIVTGTPGAGKTPMIRQLEIDGFSVVEEAATDVIALYRAVDSTGATIDFLLSETRDLTAARSFFQKALASPGHPRPRVITVDGNPSYPTVIDELKTATCSRSKVVLPSCTLQSNEHDSQRASSMVSKG